MSLADLASIGSFISGIVVLVSLVYLGLQVRQAKFHQQAAIRQGLANDAYYASFLAGTKRLVCEPGLRVQWKQQRAGFLPEFVAVMDKLLAETQPISNPDVLTAWKAAIAAEKAGSAHG